MTALKTKMQVGTCTSYYFLADRSDGHVTLKGKGHDPYTFRAQYLENSWIWYLATVAYYLLMVTQMINIWAICKD